MIRGSIGWFFAAVLVDFFTKVGANTVASNWPMVRQRVNPKLAFGSASSSSPVVVLILLVLAAVAVMAHSGYLTYSGRLDPQSFGFLTGGTVANALDRAWSGHVHDWLAVGGITANLADFFIFFGLIQYLRAALNTRVKPLI